MSVPRAAGAGADARVVGAGKHCVRPPRPRQRSLRAKETTRLSGKNRDGGFYGGGSGDPRQQPGSSLPAGGQLSSFTLLRPRRVLLSLARRRVSFAIGRQCKRLDVECTEPKGKKEMPDKRRDLCTCAPRFGPLRWRSEGLGL